MQRKEIAEAIANNLNQKLFADIEKKYGKKVAEEKVNKLKITDLLAKQIVKEVFSIIIDTVIKEGRLEMRNFGVFSIKERKPRKARNPKTGAEVSLPARKVLLFKPGYNVKKKLLRG